VRIIQNGYLDVIDAAQFGGAFAVKGCMVIKPTGYAIWEHIQAQFGPGVSKRPAMSTLISFSYHTRKFYAPGKPRLWRALHRNVRW
jgi:hypothetical protein